MFYDISNYHLQIEVVNHDKMIAQCMGRREVEKKSLF